MSLLAPLLVLLLLGAPPAAADDRQRTAERVLVVTLPTLAWQDVIDQRPPVLSELLARSAVGSVSVRTIGPVTSLAEGYATIGAGNRATAEEAFAGLAFPADAPYEGDTAGEVFERRCGCPPEGAVFHLGIGPIQRINDRLLYGSEPGALGQALDDAGLRAAIVANADTSLQAAERDRHREATLAVMDESGRVAAGTVNADLLTDDPAAPFGTRNRVDAMAAAARDELASSDVVLVEAGDLDRADRYDAYATEEATELTRAAALEAADALLGRLLDDVDLERDLVVVVTPNPRRALGDQMGIAALAGPGVEPGLLRSATTRRDGFVTLPDVAPTILDALGVDVPDEMSGTLMSSAGGGPVDVDGWRSLARDDELARFRDDATGPASVAFIVFQVLTYGAAVLALTRLPRMRPWVAFAALITLAQPSLAFLSRLVPYDGLGVAGYVVALFAAGAALAGAALLAGRWLGRRAGPAAALVPPLLLVGCTLAVLLVDIVSGGRLQLNTVFGYSPTVAGRFAGFGNLAFALLAMAAIVLATGLWGVASLRRGARAPADRRRALAAVVAFAVVVVVADGAPTFGSDVGGVLALVPAFAVVVLLLAGARLGWARVAGIGAATIAALGAFAAVDLARPAESRTHLGRFVARLFDGQGVLTVLNRKINANVSILTSSVWTLIIPVAVAFLAFLVWRRQGFLQELQERVPGLRACLVGALVVGAIGFALNDSGVAVPAMMLAVLLPYVTFLVLRTGPA